MPHSLQHSIGHTFAEDSMFAIQPRCDNSRDEELGAICVGASIGHA